MMQAQANSRPGPEILLINLVRKILHAQKDTEVARTNYGAEWGWDAEPLIFPSS